MRAYHQGQLDFFCAVYAIINALTLCYGIRLEDARKLLEQSLAGISSHSGLWLATLRNQSDFHWLVRALLKALEGQGSFFLRASWPFAPDAFEPTVNLFVPNPREADGVRLYHSPPEPEPDLKTVWQTLCDWLPDERNHEDVRPRTAVLRFFRFLPRLDEPIVRHWSTARHRRGGVISLFDATPDKSAVHELPLANLMPSARHVPDDKAYLYIEPASVCLLERRRW